MNNELERDSIHSGSLKRFEKRKSRHAWTEHWAVLGSNSLRLFTNYESFLNATDQPKLIKLTADTFCESVNKNNQTFQFKIHNGDTFVFKCESGSSREEWMNKLGVVLSGFCRNCCFHCSGEYDPRISIISDSGYSDRSSQSSTDGQYSQPGEVIQSTFNSRCTNISRHSTEYEDQITVKSPLKIYDEDQTVHFSFNKTEKAKTESQTDSVAPNVDDTQTMRNERSPKNSFGYSFGTDATDNATTSSLKLFDNQKKRFSTFSKRSSLERNRPTVGFSNPKFEPENGSFASEFPEIPTRISKVYDAPLDYDVPALSKNDPRRGSLKVLVGKNNWKKYQATVEKNVLLLSDTESSPSEEIAMRIELKPKIKFTLLPRRNHDYRFKMTTGSSEYFFKTLNAVQRDSWIKVLTEASSSVCQMACPRCCTNASQNVPSCTESNTSQSDTSDADGVFYVGMTKPDEGITFMNLCPQESPNVPNGASEETNIERDQNDQNQSSLRSGYLKTNAIDNGWGQYWVTIMGKELALHSSEENLDSLKIIQLSPNAQCKMAKRSLYDFRFTLVASAVECYEFKCASAHDRREWITSMEKVSGRAEQDLNAGTRISEIVTKMKENESRLEKIQQQQQQERVRQQQLEEQRKEQQELLQQQRNEDGESQELYEMIPAETNQAPSSIPSRPQRLVPPTTLPPKRQEHFQSTEASQELYEAIPADKQEEELQFTFPLKQQQENMANNQDIYELMTADNNEQQQNGEEGQDVYELMASSNNSQQAQNTDDVRDIYDDFVSGNIPQCTLVPPPPQHLPPLTPPQQRKQEKHTLPPPPQQLPPRTPPQERKQQEQQHTLPPPPQELPPLTPPQQRKQQEQLSPLTPSQQKPHQQQQESVENCQYIYDDFAALENIRQEQHLPPPPPQQLPPLTPPQKRQQQQEQLENTDEGGEEVYELVPGDNSQQEVQPTSRSEEEVNQVVPAEKIEQQQKKSKEKKGKRILPHWHINKSKKKEKKQQKGKSDPEEKHDQELDTKQEDNEQYSDCKVEDKNAEFISRESTESHNKPLWNFEEHVQIVPQVMPQRNSASSTKEKEVGGLELQADEGSDVYVGEDSKPDVICSENKKTLSDLSNMTEDVERFLTQVLGKLSNLPDDVNKERLELSQRLQKHLNLPGKSVGKKKPPLPTPTVPVTNNVDEVDEGEYGDVASVVAPTTQDDDAGQETYDDVAAAIAADPEEMYDDVSTNKTTAAEAPEEMYDDVSPQVNAKQRSLSRMSNSSDTLGAKDVTDPKKASDITDKVYEGYLEKYKGKGLFKKWQRRYCVLTPLALYYYENQKDQRQKGQIILPASDSTLRQGCHNFPEVKDKKLCFELFNNDRNFLFKVGKESELGIWMNHITAALHTDLSDEQSKLMRQKSMKINDDDIDDEVGEGEELYETIDTMQSKTGASNSSNDSEPVVEEEMYELTDQFSQVAEPTPSSAPAAGPALPSRNKTAGKEETPPSPVVEEEEFEVVDEDDMEDYQLPDSSAPKPGASLQNKPSSGSPTLPPRPNSSQDAPHLPPPRGTASTPASQKPPELPSRSSGSTPPSQKKTPPALPTRTTPTLPKKSLSTTAEEPDPNPPAPKVEPKPEPEVITPSPPYKPKPGEQFDYNRVYVALWNCDSSDEDDLEFSRGNYLYIREKIPNSDWWVASLMDIPEIRVGLVPRNFIMPAYDL